MDKITFTVKEVAKILNLGITTTYELIRCNAIPNIKIGKRIIIPKESLMLWLNKNTVGA